MYVFLNAFVITACEEFEKNQGLVKSQDMIACLVSFIWLSVF